MLALRKILFPVDFSECSAQTAPYVAWIARTFGSQLVVLHVVDLSLMAPAPLIHRDLFKRYEDLIQERRECELTQFASERFDGLRVHKLLEIGDPATTITRYAERNEADLIVIPTHGLGTFRWLLLGSVTAKVLHDAACPVWTTVHAEILCSPAGQAIHTILCGIDLYSDAVRVIRAASDVAAKFGASVRLIHAVAAPEAKPGSNLDSGLKRFLFDTARDEIAKCQEQAGTDWDVCLQNGTVSSVLRDAAMKSGADLIVIGRGHLRDRIGRFRTHVGAIIQDSPCPVLSF